MIDAQRLNGITDRTIRAAINVHKALGPGLLESAYEACLAYELAQNGLKVEQQKPLPIVYKEVQLGCGYRLDLLLDDLVIIEIKSIESLAPIYEAQLLSCLKLADKLVELLIDFNVKLLKHGIRRIVNHFPE